MVIFMAVLLPEMVKHDPNPPPPGMFLIMAVFMSLIYGSMTVPSYIAGYALLKKKRWAKTASIVAGVCDSMHFPFGAAVAIYTFWFLFSDPGKYLYDRPAYALAPGQPTWANQTNSAPPDWR